MKKKRDNSDFIKQELDKCDLEKLQVFKPAFLEELMLFFVQVISILVINEAVIRLVIFVAKTLFGHPLEEDNFIYSLVYIPLVYMFTNELSSIFDVFFVQARLSKEDIIVKTGLYNQTLDKLEIKNIENVEIYATYFGRKFDYGHLRISTFGSFVLVPFIRKPGLVKDKIESYKSEMK